MRIRLLVSRGRAPHWRDGTHEEILTWARRTTKYGVRWTETCLPRYLDTLNADPIYSQRDCDEMAVVLEDFPISALTELVSDWDVTVTLVACERWNWAEEGDPVSHSLVISDEED